MVVTISKRAPWNLGKQMLQIFPEPCEKCGLGERVLVTGSSYPTNPGF
ncbi:MAG: hypothetical protein AAF443_07615 [Chlamydiota bacterium]